jgi:hypothetical protein
MIEAKFVLGGLEAFLDAPAGSFDPDDCLDRGALGTPCCEIGHIIIRGVAPDQQATRPQAGSVFIGIHPVSTHPSVLEELVDGSHIRWGLRVLKAVVSACLLDGYSADRLGS